MDAVARKSVLGDAVAVLAAVVALLLRFLLDPLLGDHLPFVTFFVAVLLASWYGGLRSGLVATVLGFFLALYFFVPPRFSFFGASGPNLVGLAINFMVSLAIAGFGGAMRAAHLRSRQDQLAAHEQREWLRITLASIGDAVITTDARGDVTFLNTIAESLTGWTQSEAVGRSLEDVFEIVNEQTRQPAESPVAKVIREGVVVGLANHTLLVARDGTERAIDDSAAPIRDAHGHVQGVILIFRDVTEKRRAERAVRESETRKAAILETAIDCVLTIDHEGKLVEFNPAAERVFGYRRAEVLGRPMAELIVPASFRQQHYQGLARFLATGAGPVLGRRIEMPALRADGTEFPAELSITAVQLDGPPLFTAYLRDITEQKRAEESLRESERRFKTLTSHAPVGIFQTDTEGNCLFVNERWCEIAGMPAERARGKGWVDALHPEDRERILREWYETAAAGQEFASEYRFRTPEGKVTWLSGSAVALRLETGEITGYIGTVTDITERKEAEKELQLVTDSMSAPVTRCSRDLRYLWVSKPYADWIGRPPEEIIGRNILDVIGPEAFAQLLPHFERVLSGEQVRYEEAVDFRGAGRRWVNAIYTPTFDAAGAVDGWVAVVLDVHDRKQTEERLRKKNERLHLLAEAAEVLLHADDPDAMLRTLFARISPHLGLDAYFHYAVNEAGDALRLESCVGAPEAVADHPLQTVELKGGPSTPPSVVCNLPSEFGFRASASNPLVVSDKLLGTLAFASRSRDQFDALELEFLQTICRFVTLAYERVRLIRQLREADRRKDDFLATLAHELRNPLAPIRNAVELLRRSAGNGALVAQARGLMERQLRRMVRLIDDLLEISRITRGKLQLRTERVELAAVLHDAVEAARPMIEAQGHELTVTEPPETVHLEADPTRLAQVFTNLLDNAAKYTDRDGHIWLTARREGGEAVVSVRDNGIGIAPEHLPRLFEMFSQAAPALERSQGGLGIGLALVRGLVELHGGSVEARSAGLGTGSEFTVRLPVAPEDDKVTRWQGDKVTNEPQAPGHLVTLSPCHRVRILVADDNRDAADSLALMLQTMGHQTEKAYDGLEAVRAAATFRPDAVLLDIGMPKLNGYEAARRIREQPWGKDMALIAVTGWGQEEDRRRALEAGCDHHLTKPVDPAALEKVLALVSRGRDR